LLSPSEYSDTHLITRELTEVSGINDLITKVNT